MFRDTTQVYCVLKLMVGLSTWTRITLKIFDLLLNFTLLIVRIQVKVYKVANNNNNICYFG